MFDDLYLLGLRNPSRYGDVTLREEDYEGESFSRKIHWSNGGKNQISLLHAVEYAAAGFAFHFFGNFAPTVEGTTLLGAHHHDSSTGDALCWSDIAFSGEVKVNQWVSAALAGINWVKFSLLPNIPTRVAFENTNRSFKALHQLVEEDRYEKFYEQLRIVIERVDRALLHTLRALGWEENHSVPLMRSLHREALSFSWTGRGLLKRSPAYPLAGWRLEGVDMKELGKAGYDELKDLKNESKESRRSQTLGITYLQSL